MEKWKFKKALKVILSFILCYIMCAIGACIIFVSNNIIDINIAIWSLISIVLISIIPIVILIFIYLITNFLKKEKNYKGYYREIEKMYPPAMLSFLIDGFVETNKDVLATILNLYVKKFLNIEKVNNKLNVSVNEDIKDTQSLYYHEKYIVNALKKEQRIDFLKFEEWLILDCKNNQLIYSDKNVGATILRLVMLLSIWWTLFAAFSLENIKLCIGCAVIGLFCYLGSFALKLYDKNQKGMEVAKKTKELKNYLRDYTLLKEKDYDYINLVDKYIPYALSLGEATKIENLYIEGNQLIKDIVTNTLS